MKVSELTGPALDWAVAKCEGVNLHPMPQNGVMEIHFSEPNGCLPYSPSIDWSQSGPIIEREGITIGQRFAPKFLPKNSPPVVDWTAQYFQAPHSALEVHRQHGPTPLIAAMRCYVASKLGDEVGIPAEPLHRQPL